MFWSWTRSVTLLLVGVLLVAGMATSGPADAADGGEGTYASPSWPTEWKLEMIVATRAQIPVIGSTRAEVLSTLAVRWERGPQGWIQSQQVCESRLLDRGHFVRTVLPDAFVRALPRPRFPIVLAPPARIGEPWRYSADFGRQDVGWDGVAELPTSADAPGVVDFDGDGKPGATVLIEAPIVGTGEVYVAQEGRTTVDGSLQPDGTIRGAVIVTDFAQVVLGGSSAMFSRGPEVTSDPSRSRFTLTPAPGFRCGG
jgi:hypothetical protein